MISKLTLKCFDWIVWAGSRSYILPFYWDPQTLSLKRFSTRRSVFLHYGCTVLLYIMQMYELIRLLQACFLHETTTTELVFSIPILFAVCISSALHLNTLLRKDEIAKFVTAYMQHDQMLTGKK